MNNTPKKAAKKFIVQHSLINPDFNSLKLAAEKIGYMVIEFNSLYNERSVQDIIDGLHLAAAVATSRGFTYNDKNYRLIFINEDLTHSEKVPVLAHELGHIVLGHFKCGLIIGNDVSEEYAANEFTHYLLNQPPLKRFRLAVCRHKKISVCVLILLVLTIFAGIFGYVRHKENSHYKDYYVISSGEKYHKPECSVIKNRTDTIQLTYKMYNSGQYEPCNLCLPEN